MKGRLYKLVGALCAGAFALQFAGCGVTDFLANIGGVAELMGQVGDIVPSM